METLEKKHKNYYQTRCHNGENVLITLNHGEWTAALAYLCKIHTTHECLGTRMFNTVEGKTHRSFTVRQSSWSRIAIITRENEAHIRSGRGILSYSCMHRYLIVISICW